MSRSPIKRPGRARDYGRRGPDIIRGAKNNDLEEVDAALLANPASITQVDVVTGMTAVHYASALGNFYMVKFLLEKEGLELRRNDRFDRDVLDVAIECGHQRIVEVVFAALAKYQSE